MAKDKLYLNERSCIWDCEYCEEENATPIMYMSSPGKKNKKQIIDMVCEVCMQTTKIRLPIKSYRKHRQVRIS